MDVFLEQIVNGLTIGAFYAMIALGYSMVYGVMKLINFAHGDFFALGSYFGYTLLVWGSALISNRFGLWGGMVVALVVAGIWGLAIWPIRLILFRIRCFTSARFRSAPCRWLFSFCRLP